MVYVIMDMLLFQNICKINQKSKIEEETNSFMVITVTTILNLQWGTQRFKLTKN